jgi:hypothetical protein
MFAAGHYQDSEVRASRPAIARVRSRTVDREDEPKTVHGIALVVVAAIAVGCSRDAPRPGPDVGPPEPNDPRLHADLVAIANLYDWMPDADGTWWGPLDCMAPTRPGFRSRAEGGPHGRKIYTLFIKDYASYAALSGRDAGPPLLRIDDGSALMAPLAGMSQVIVKEAWTPVPSAAYGEHCAASTKPTALRPVTVDGVRYRACDRAGLFVMYRPTTPPAATDDGWLYGTVQLEARPHDGGGTILEPIVTSAGLVRSCMGCHAKAPHGRLFGIPASG